MYRWRNHLFTFASLVVKGVMELKELSQMYRWRNHLFTFSPLKALAIFSPFHLFTFSPLKGVSHLFTLSPLLIVHRIPKVSIEFHYFENPFFLQT